MGNSGLNHFEGLGQNPQMINSGQRFIVVLPYAVFTVSLKKDGRQPNNHKIQVQAGRRVGGKPVNCSCLLGKKGESDLEKPL
ncbi:MAG: hypothetical protein M5U34_34000 [Chloroflexi bacterium]|nr:hypothetical protein [Chloroflexota bacterium]